MSDIFDDIDLDVVDEIKDGIKEFLKCGICNSRIKVSSKSNTCHFCDTRVCNKCKVGNICIHCVEKLPSEVVDKVNSLRKKKNIGAFLFIMGFLVFFTLPIMNTFEISVIIIGSLLSLIGVVVYFIFYLLMWKTIEDSESKKKE
jgi:hypothetical protein